MTRIILVRHGQTEWNRVERFRGRADVPLDQAGVAQAEAVAQRIAAEWQPAAVYSSPLARAVMTAEAIAKPLSLTARIHQGLVDIDYGQWQGLTPDQVQERWPEIHHAWYSAPGAAQIPGGETLAELHVRGLAAVRGLASLHEGQTIVLVGHTVINRVILLGVLGLGTDRFWRLRQEPCAISVFEAEGGDWTLVSLNDTCHVRFSGAS